MSLAKSTEIEMIKRVREVYRLLLSGADRLKVHQYASEKWSSSERSTDELIRRANVIMEEKFDVDAEKMKNRSLKSRMDLFWRALEAKELSTAHEIRKDLDKLIGLYPSIKSELSVDMQIVFDITAKVVMTLNKTLPDNCPHCKKALTLREETIKELEHLSQGLGGKNG